MGRRLVLLALLAGCGAKRAVAPAPTPVPTAPTAEPPASAVGPDRHAAPHAPPALPAPQAARNWTLFKRQMAARLMLANRDRVYEEKAPPVLLAVPVLQVELLASGHIKRISVLREPRQAKDTIELARQALHRAAPFGEMHHLAAPWVFTESFLFDEQRRFKPRSLD